MLGSWNLTGTNDEQRRTAPGMAFWAGSGPFGKTCEDCAFKNYFAPKLDKFGIPVGSRKSKGCA
jgi:hypothetical protein